MSGFRCKTKNQRRKVLALMEKLSKGEDLTPKERITLAYSPSPYVYSEEEIAEGKIDSAYPSPL